MSLRLLAAVVALSACRGDDPSTTPTDDTTDTDTDTDTGTPVIDTAWWPPFTGDTGDDDPILHDALSMPAEPTHEVADFESAQACQLCHSDHYDEWSTSMHAYAMVDPVFKALVAVRQADFDGTEDKFCLSCHSAIAVRSGEVQPGFDFAGVQGVVEEGITCESCHTISEVERVNNGGHVLDPAGPMRGPIEDPAQSSHHDSEYSELFTERSGELCGSCHDVIETNGLNLERPYEEFVESPAYEEGTRCQVCHMPETTEPAAAGGPDRQRSSHRFVGVDVPLLPGWASASDEQIIRDEVHELLQGSVQVELSTPSQVIAGEQLDVVIDVTNLIDAHNFPTGSTFIRQAWLEVIATDAQGTVLYATGDLDANGDLRNFFSELDPYGDDDLIVFTSQLIDPTGTPEIFTWRASEHWVNSIPPLYGRTYTLFVPTEQAAQGPITVDARLRFRTHAPYLLRELQLDELIDRLEIVDIDVTRAEVPMVPASGGSTGDTGSP